MAKRRALARPLILPTREGEIFCPYAGRPVSLASTSPEHILPRAIGGGLTIPVDARMNSIVGGSVDRNFVDSDVIRTLRVNHCISNRGEDPELVVPHVFNINGVPRRAKLIYSPGVSPRVEVEPDVERDGPYWLTTFFGQSLEENEEQHQRQLRKRLRDLRKGFGKEVEFDLDTTQDPSQVVQVPLPRPAFTFQLTRDAMLRFLAKVALAATTKRFGEAWAQSEHAEALRGVVFRGADLASPPLHGQGYRVPHGQEGGFSLMSCFATTADEHEISYFPHSDGTWCAVIIFHLVAAVIRVSNVSAAPCGWGVRFRPPKRARELSLFGPQARPPVEVPLEFALAAAEDVCAPFDGVPPPRGLLVLDRLPPASGVYAP